MAIKEFITGHYYIFKTTLDVPPQFSFLFGDAVHYCIEGKGSSARFSLDFYHFINFYNLDSIYDVTEEIRKDKLKEFLCS